MGLSGIYIPFDLELENPNDLKGRELKYYFFHFLYLYTLHIKIQILLIHR